MWPSSQTALTLIIFRKLQMFLINVQVCPFGHHLLPSETRTMLRFFSSKPQRTKMMFPHSSLRRCFAHTCSANHLIIALWGRKSRLPNRSCGANKKQQDKAY